MNKWQERVVTAWLLRLMEEVEGEHNMRYHLGKAERIYRRHQAVCDRFVNTMRGVAA